ncbi:hypothetical protein [Haloferula sp. A504]|uniref:hypothetical protein n=1 Tax=Haloferula sp. A504 TaxID=3373601 RepID=UPI0031C6556B|nr:hypothetical protein [Verrucomicrobiaceae bacterium E54]
MRTTLKRLTHEQLAALAAALPTGDANERVNLAAEIWKAAGDLLVNDEFYADMAAKQTRPLQEVLCDAMPKASLGDRTAAYREFLISLEHYKKGGLTQDQARDMAVELLTQHREKGVPNAQWHLGAFQEWLERRKAANYSERGKKGAAAKRAKKSLGAKKSGKKRAKQGGSPRK